MVQNVPMEEEIVKEKLLFEMHKKNEEWFSAHYQELQKKYGSKFFAVKDQQIVAVEDEMEKLLRVLEEKGIDVNLVFVTSIPPEGVALIL